MAKPIPQQFIVTHYKNKVNQVIPLSGVKYLERLNPTDDVGATRVHFHNGDHLDLFFPPEKHIHTLNEDDFCDLRFVEGIVEDESREYVFAPISEVKEFKVSLSKEKGDELLHTVAGAGVHTVSGYFNDSSSVFAVLKDGRVLDIGQDVGALRHYLGSGNSLGEF